MSTPASLNETLHADETLNNVTLWDNITLSTLDSLNCLMVWQKHFGTSTMFRRRGGLGAGFRELYRRC